jgi:plasmid stabilization system protein ParE
MKRKVVLSKRAATKLTALLEYLESEWSLKSKNDFISKLDRAIGLIAVFLNSFKRIEHKKGVHRCVITNQTTMYYTHDDTTVNILTIFDNRQHPGRLPQELG